MEDKFTNSAVDIDVKIIRLRETFNSGITKEQSWRRSQLESLQRLVLENEEEIFAAVKQDLGKHPFETFRDEVGIVIKTIHLALKSLNKWMSGKKATLPLSVFPASAELLPEPLGVVLIIASWNFPFGLTLEPLIGAIAAGNTAAIKPSELAPASSSTLARLINSYMDQTAIKVIQGGSQIGQKLMHHKWGKVLFTGSASVGRKVMASAAENLTPVVLQLGGKCPAVVDSLSSHWAKHIAINRILSSKFGTCAGQVCIGIDYILVEEEFCSTLVHLLKVGIGSMFGKYPRELGTVARIINEKHFLRLSNLLDEPMVKNSIVHGGALDRDNLFIEPTLLVDPPLKSGIMTDEIFGPLLPIITLKKIADSIGFINSMARPMAVYAFTNNETLKKKLVEGTCSGSIVFNDAILQYACDSLPYGGVGESGFGRYHGKFTFDAFSHEKVILKRSYLMDIWFRYPPWNQNTLALLRAAYTCDYLRMVLIILGLGNWFCKE